MRQALYVLFCCIAYLSNAQDKALDRIINKSVFGKGALIFVKHGTVLTDSTPVKRIDHFRKDSMVRIKFMDNRALLFPKGEFWGLVTDYNERRRFYNNETYIVWRTTAPYIYKNMKSRNENIYYFSESLTGDIHPLLALKNGPVVSDTAHQNILRKFIAEHKIGEKPVYVKPYISKVQKPDDESLLVLISEIIYIFSGDNRRSLSEQKQRILNSYEYKSRLPDKSVYR